MTADTPPTLAAALAAAGANSRQTGPRCGVATIYNQLDAAKDTKGRDALTSALANDALTGADVADAVTSAGYHLSSQTVLRHRRRGTGNGCRCTA